jgi:hypothetical protein
LKAPVRHRAAVAANATFRQLENDIFFGPLAGSENPAFSRDETGLCDLRFAPHLNTNSCDGIAWERVVSGEERG